MADDLLLVPVQLQAFVLNPEVCNQDGDDGARITPITQPNYTFLRLDNFVLQGDVLNHADMHNSAPWDKNSRMADLGARPDPAARRNRHGVYVHWILPQVYRTGLTSSDSVPEPRRDHERLRRGLPPRDGNLTSGESSSTPEYLQTPTRWIVVRKLDVDSIEPPTAKPIFKEYQAWVIESDFLWKLDCIPQGYDLEVDMAPFVVGKTDGADADIVQQAEVFIGRKTPLEEWTPSADNHYMDNLSLLRSNNQLFADCQMHNSNVFSMLDNFAYTGPDGSQQYLDKANASYYLLGWHKDDATDPLYDNTKHFTHAQKLDGLSMTLAESGIDDVTKAWLDSTDPARLCCHGAMYDVAWNHGSKPGVVPADNYAARIKNQELPALAVGTSPIDALITYIKARQWHESDSDLVAKLEEDILAIDSLLHARDDGVEGQREAKDTVYNWNFSRSKGGTHFFLGGEDSAGRPTNPSHDSVRDLDEINELQLLLDGCERLVKQRRWDMFSLWWKYVTDVSHMDRPNENPAYNKDTADLANRIGEIQSRMATLQTQIENMKEGANLAQVKKGTQPFFYRARDPTLLVGGVESGWPSDFSDKVSVRIPVQTVVSDDVPAAVSQLAADIRKALPDTMPLKEVASLLGEFFTLLPEQTPPSSPPEGHAYPQFHVPTKHDPLPRDQWGDRQPWFPLYVEWEVEYTHIPFDWWALDEQASRLSDNKLSRYGVEVPSGKPLWEEIAKRPHNPDSRDPPDTRILSGRVLILPQPSFSLASKVNQLFSDTPPKILNQYLSPSERQILVDNISQLSYLSCPLTGLTEGLLTLNMGTHVKPEYKEVTRDVEKVTAIRAAEFNDAGLTKTNIELIAGNSGLTPYASSTSFATDKYCPFKPVTHGQMRFRKLNIIDKFGQAVVAIDPQPRKEGHPPLYPSISDFYEPQPVLVDGREVANTVVQNNGGACEFIQLPPQINQNARLNAEFVTTAAAAASPTERPFKGKGAATKTTGPTTTPYWRPTTEWENPIWGWIVANYADYGIQLFLKDGTFYGEVRIGGPNGALDSPKWSPFEPPAATGTVSRDLARLDALIKRLKQPDYLKGFWYMLTTALDSLPPAPNSYAQFLGSVVGKPLALVNTAWSLELDSPPLTNQSTKPKGSKPERALIGPDDDDDKSSYTFHVKLGDKERGYDGLIGYFDGFPEPDSTSDEELDYDHIKTYFYPKKKNPSFANLVPINKSNYPALKPYYAAPFPENTVSPLATAAAAYTDARNAELSKHVYGAVVDPFTAVHAYSSFLPARELALRPWTWQGALDNMVAFLHAGPFTLVDSDVREYDSDQRLTTDNAKQRPPFNVGLPALVGGDWNWLQPYVDPHPPAVGATETGGGDGDAPVPVYNAYGIEQKGNLLSPGFQAAPYSTVEGFLMLRRPIMTEDPNNG
ncbi:hypothetical protein C8A00DRAFT_35005 [Chaetomidium leptoderma]|uniref:Uncharacterized protein n=1 Tax=Chaetomidium leptoderma TaxID=669021 RepID=A0AAN6VKZ0_9PEZI|nr:hypothetical protein C8A00DRAFT_35005 [Chaetomidium leptoderma]